MKQITLIGISILLLIIIAGCTKTIEKTIVINNSKECEVCSTCPPEKICEVCEEKICDNTELTKERLLNARLINEVENYKKVSEEYFNKSENIEDCMYNLTIMQEKLNKISDVIK